MGLRAVVAVALAAAMFSVLAVPQVLDPCAANAAEPRQRRGIGHGAHQNLEPVAGALQWRAVVRRAEKHKLLELAEPQMPITLRVMAGTASDEAAHAVRDDGELVEMEPRLEPLQQGRQVAREIGERKA